MHSIPCPNLVNWKHFPEHPEMKKHKNYVFKKSEYCWIQNVRGRNRNFTRSWVYGGRRSERKW
ncbi:conserved hypothetical protein [Leptospira interrogans serovar Manilae]|uniref:Uncharacterized protein n=1 Tax=Leptospira interrogans serovar Manilae TaxID=214675 RepID=A0AAQ1SPP4_LEPIR|nr:conserved hypothetical protein [Leptospira interrogans serovar Manilae]